VRPCKEGRNAVVCFILHYVLETVSTHNTTHHVLQCVCSAALQYMPARTDISVRACTAVYVQCSTAIHARTDRHIRAGMYCSVCAVQHCNTCPHGQTYPCGHVLQCVCSVCFKNVV
jgi:hypothetical protein